MIDLASRIVAAAAPAYDMREPMPWLDAPLAIIPRVWGTIPIAIGLGLLAAVWVARRRLAQRRHLRLVHDLVAETSLSRRDVRVLDRLAAGGGVPVAASIMISAGAFDRCRERARAAGITVPDAALDTLRRRLFGREAGRSGKEKK